MNIGSNDAQTARVDAIEAKYREHGREGARRSPGDLLEHFDEVQRIGERTVEADFNPRGAGQELHATVTVVAVRPPTAEEERRGRV